MWVDLIGFIPFTAALILILANIVIMGVVLGPILLLSLYRRMKTWVLLWTEIMVPEEVSASRLQRIGASLVWVGSIGAVVACLVLGLTEQAPGGLGIGLGLVPFLLLILVGSFMLGGRDQVEAIQEETMPIGREESRA